MSYDTIHMVRRVMPTDRLAVAEVAQDGIVTFSYRAPFIHPALVRDMGELSHAVAATGMLDLVPDIPGHPPHLISWLSRDFELEEPMRPRVTVTDLISFEIRCRADMIDPALLREVNEQVLPVVCGILVPPLVKG